MYVPNVRERIQKYHLSNKISKPAGNEHKSEMVIFPGTVSEFCDAANDALAAGGISPVYV